MKLELVIIDPQNDFCNPKGALFVTGADKDAERLGAMITRLGNNLKKIHVTLDTHHYADIAHPSMWINSEGKNPSPFTLISEADVDNGVWRALHPSLQNAQVNYVHQLAKNGRYPLCIWPPHCLIGTWGHNVVSPVGDALTAWEKRNPVVHFVDYVTKGSNYLTEHYSAIQADVPDPTDAGTTLNIPLIQTLQEADVIGLSGEALSHCVANTVRDIANNFGEDNIKKLVLLEDTSSNVPGFEKFGTDFVKEMVARGMKVDKSTTFFA